ncbi:MAG: sulfite reductase [Betaproteobacteria bacterium RIFCSPLOWO2_02_67_12]|nr:MAG: sulfite reductase [Betaproteobacteria bacterium RIFCSPLOWO2_02_67_12]
MYTYDDVDQRLVEERGAQFRDQTRRYLAKDLSEDEFRPLRLQNGLYLQRHAPMLRVAIPYGLLSSRQLRTLAHIARTYDRGYGHFSTRQNLQFNWPRLEDVPEILAELAVVQMHAIQTSGNCIRNVTTDHFAGVARDEIVDSFVWCELIRQWSALNPEFAYLPRKFKIAVNGAAADRAATFAHDIGLHALKNGAGEVGFRVIAGGGMGRTPVIGHVIREFLPWRHLLTYLEAILRLYNRYGRRDNKYKARIKILVKELTPEAFREKVEAEWLQLADGPATLSEDDVRAIEARFERPPYQVLADATVAALGAFGAWMKRNVHPHKQPGYAAVSVSLKKTGVPPGDVTAAQMDAIAALADRYAFGELRVSHEQNLVFADVRQADLQDLWRELRALGLATPNIGLLTNIISCPGGDFCSLANAKSIPVAEAIQRRFDDLDYLHDIGELDLNLSGCMNSCGHHHVGHIGILGVDKHGEEWYQITIGGNQGLTRPGAPAALGQVIGPSFARDDVPGVIERLIEAYLARRESDDERFVDTVWRIGIEPFKEKVYGKRHQAQDHRRRQLAAA